MKTLFTLILLASSLASADCLNKISLSNAQKAIDQAPLLDSVLCKPADKCVCFDQVSDWTVMEIKAGALAVDAAKLAAKQAKLDADKQSADNLAQAKAQRLAYLKTLKNKTLSLEETQAVVQILVKEMAGD